MVNAPSDADSGTCAVTVGPDWVVPAKHNANAPTATPSATSGDALAVAPSVLR